MTIIDKVKGSPSITFVKNQVITVTKRTIRFSHNVYLFHNIEGFSEKEVDIVIIPFWITTTLFVIGVIISSYNLTLGWILTIFSTSGMIWNFCRPKYYGLLLTFNSGNKFLFVTTDRPGIKSIISTIYDFFETEKEATIEIHISQRSASTNINRYGSYVSGNIFGDVGAAEKYDR